MKLALTCLVLTTTVPALHSAQGSARASAPDAEQNSAQHAATEAAAATLRGRIRAATPSLVANAHIVARQTQGEAMRALQGSREDRVARAKSSARGSFRLRVPRAGTWVLRAYSEDGRHASSIARGVHSDRLVSLRMRPACSLRIAGTTRLRWLLWAFDRDRRDFFVCDAGICTQARRELPPLPPGRYRLRLLAETQGACEYLPLVLGPGEERELVPALRAPAELRLLLPGYSGPATLVLPPPLAFPRAQNGASQVDSAPTRRRALSIQNGKVAAPLPGLDVAMTLTLERPGHAPHAFYLPPVASGATLERTLETAPSAQLRLRTRERGDAIVLWDRFGRGRRAFALEKGAQEVAGVPPQRCLVVFRAADSKRLACVATPIDRSKAVDVVAEDPARVELELRDTRGGVIREARLRAWPTSFANAAGLEELYPTLEAISKRNGALRLDGLTPGRWTLRIDAPPHVSLEWHVDLRAQQTLRDEVKLDLGRKVFGVILDPRGRPATNAMVSLADPLPNARIGPRYATTDARGRFAFYGLPTGAVRVEAIRSGGAHTESARGLAQPGEELRLTLRDEDPTLRK